ncbi:hypothetical protein CPB85DRAFT_399344 [Mucidula mucida]|nr:hypothetical protein CPB85DRAFT_399344 [Mucidula mucida]
MTSFRRGQHDNISLYYLRLSSHSMAAVLTPPSHGTMSRYVAHHARYLHKIPDTTPLSWLRSY